MFDTGSQTFEKFLRGYVNKVLGGSLSSAGISLPHALTSNNNSNKTSAIASERDIFEMLRIPYLSPHLRNA